MLYLEFFLLDFSYAMSEFKFAWFKLFVTENIGIKLWYTCEVLHAELGYAMSESSYVEFN